MQAQVSKKTSGQDLTAFQTISDFVCDLQDCFGGSKHQLIRPLNLYHRLISKLSFRDEELILRHLNVFKEFCVDNREQIRHRNREWTSPKIEFTDRIYIDMGYIMKQTDEESEEAIWQYLLTISAYLDPENKTKDLLKQLKQDDSNEGNFLANMIETLGTQLPNLAGGANAGAPNPMEMMGSLMNSDLFSGLMGSMMGGEQSGKLDMGKLMNTMTGLMETVKSEIEKSDDPILKQLTQMVQQMPMPPVPPSSEQTTPTPSTITDLDVD